MNLRKPWLLFVLLLGGIVILPVYAFNCDLSFRLYGGLGCVDGGDLSRSISGWRSYYRDRQGEGFLSSFKLGEMHWGLEFGGEAVWALSPRWSLSLGGGYILQKASGKITTQTTRREEIPVSPTGRSTLDFDGATEQNPVFTKSTVPIAISLHYFLALNTRWTLTLGGGGGIYLGRLEFRESYKLQSESTSEQQTGYGVVRYVDRLATVGEYSEKTKCTGYGVHGRIGLEFKLGPHVYLSIAALGRWVNMKGWEGTRADASQWQRIYGLWGELRAEGEEERTENGQYWAYDLKDEMSGKSYRLLAFRSEAPSSSSRPANFNLSGISLHIGLGFRIGEKD